MQAELTAGSVAANLCVQKGFRAVTSFAGTLTADQRANIGGALSAYALGMARDAAGSFVWGFFGIGALCLTGAGLSVVLARMRTRALAAQNRAATP